MSAAIVGSDNAPSTGVVARSAWRARFAETVLENLDREGYLVAPASDGRHVCVWPFPPPDIRLDILQVRRPLKRLVYERDRWAELLFKATEQVGASLWFSKRKQALVVAMLKTDRPSRAITEDEARAFLQQVRALFRLILDDRVAVANYLRRTRRRWPPPGPFHEVLFEFPLRPTPRPWKEPESMEELEARLAASEVELADVEARLRARRKARRLA